MAGAGARFEPLGEEVLHEGPVFTVSVGQVRAPGGEILTREYVRHPGAVMVVPVVGDGEVVLVRQYRAAINQDLLEIPAGKRDVADEPPAQTAARELREEVGLASPRLQLLASFFNTPGFSDEYSYCYLATDCYEVPDQRQGAEEEHMVIEKMSLTDAVSLVEAGDIVDAKTIIGLMLARDELARQ